MIQTVEISIHNGIRETIKALIQFSKKVCYINNEKYDVNEEFLDEIMDTIYLWKNEYGYDENIDSEEFDVTVKTDEGKEKFHGKGKYPQNYSYLKELLGDYYD